MADELLVLEVNHDIVPVRHGDHKATSVGCPHYCLIWDLLLLSEELLINVFEDAGDRKSEKTFDCNLNFLKNCFPLLSSHSELTEARVILK